MDMLIYVWSDIIHRAWLYTRWSPYVVTHHDDTWAQDMLMMSDICPYMDMLVQYMPIYGHADDMPIYGHADDG